MPRNMLQRLDHGLKRLTFLLTNCFEFQLRIQNKGYSHKK